MNSLITGALLLLSSVAFSQINLPVSEFIDAYKSTPNAQLLDVRTPAEWKEGKVKVATCVDYMSTDFSKNVTKLDKSKPIFIYCASGGRSAKAAIMLQEAGFTKVYNLTGGGFSQLRDNGLK